MCVHVDRLLMSVCRCLKVYALNGTMTLRIQSTSFAAIKRFQSQVKYLFQLSFSSGLLLVL